MHFGLRGPGHLSAAFGPPPAATGVPANTVAPSIGGIRTVGQTLTANPGVWTQFPTGYAYAWKKAGVANGTTTQTYVLQPGDAGAAIACAVTASNGFGSTTASSSAVTPAAALAISGSPATTGVSGAAYSFTPGVSGGHAAYGFSLSGALGTSGLSFNAATGALTATALGPAGTYGLFTIAVTDADGLTQSLAPFSIAVSGGGGGGSGAGQARGFLLLLTKAS